MGVVTIAERTRKALRWMSPLATVLIVWTMVSLPLILGCYLYAWLWGIEWEWDYDGGWSFKEYIAAMIAMPMGMAYAFYAGIPLERWLLQFFPPLSPEESDSDPDRHSSEE